MDTRLHSSSSCRSAGVIPFAFPGVPGVKCLFTTVQTGSISFDGASVDRGRIMANRRRLLEDCGPGRWVELKQVHGDAMAVDPEPMPVDASPLIQADGSCTREKGLALLIKTADCQPILLCDAKGSAVAALHAGWRGNAMQFPEKGVRIFCERYGLEPKDLMAVRGPSLGPAAAEFINFDREWEPRFAPWFDRERRTMDLWSLARRQLADAGIAENRIFSLDLCTKSLPELFFSHRRGVAGRMGSLIWIQES